MPRLNKRCCMSIWNLCLFGMDICQMGIYVHSEWTYVRLEFMSIPNGHVCQIGIIKTIVVCPFGIYVHSEWTYVRWEFMSIPNGHMSVWNLCPFRMDMYVGLE